MDFTNISLGLAFVAGLASFLSPCVFSLVPAYVGYLGGRAVGGEVSENNRFVTFTHGLAFVLGFSLVFITLGVAASAFGKLLFELQYWLAKIGGIIVIVFGLHMIGIFRIPFLEYDTRVQQLPDRKWGYLSSAMMGIFFSAGWSPCVGPVLGAILTLTFNGGSISSGVALLSAYSAGLAIPFLIAALGLGWVSVTLRKYGKVMHYVEIVMGVVLVIVGFMLFSGIFSRIAQAGQFFWVDFGL
jgi:cytochrome c-type biogenesis protein